MGQAILPADALSSASQPAGKPARSQVTYTGLRYVVTAGDVIDVHPDNRPDPRRAAVCLLRL